MGKSKNRKTLGLILSSAVLLTLAWPHIGNLSFLIFVAFVPLLILEDSFQSKRSSKSIFFPVFLCFLLWNIATTWFIFLIKLVGSTFWEEFISRITASGLTYVANAVIMTLAFWLFHFCKRKVGARLGYLGFVVFWLGFEYLHMHWDINWPWLNLGNVFANNTWLIQWYEYTGSPGGSLWILISNILVFHIWKAFKITEVSILQRNFRIIKLGLWLVIPLIISLIIYATVENKGEKTKMLALQPNVDPYEEKFQIDPIIQLQEMLDLTEVHMEDGVRLILFPETALLESARIYKNGDDLIFTGPWEGKYETTETVKSIRRLLDKFPEATVIAGISDRKHLASKDEITPTARYYESLDVYYDSYNSLIFLKKDQPIKFYRKSKLVPGVESVPFGSLMKKIESFALDLGGTTGSLGIQKERTNFEIDGHQLGSMVCYESVFGEFVSKFVASGAEALSISTNDSWWQESPGYKQLLAYARLRAIENRRTIIRSANTGISCYIDQRGNIVDRTEWWEETALVGEVQWNSELTFYTRHGDFISRIACLLAVIVFLYSIVKGKQKSF